MTTRKPFGIKTQNDINIANKIGEMQKANASTKKNASSKIIKVQTKKISKIYINKTASVEATAVGKSNTPEKSKNRFKILVPENLNISLEATLNTELCQQNPLRTSYSIQKLLNMEPQTKPSPPLGFETWPVQMRNPVSTPKVSTTQPSAKTKKVALKKRSPVGELASQKGTDVPSIKIDLAPIVSKPINVEKDERRLDQRQKQVDLGKKTLSYLLYCNKIPIFERKKGMPVTPRKNQICSKRSWDGQVRKWRRLLHEYDPKSEQEIEEAMKLFPEETKQFLLKKNDPNETIENIENESDKENEIEKDN